MLGLGHWLMRNAITSPGSRTLWETFVGVVEAYSTVGKVIREYTWE